MAHSTVRSHRSCRSPWRSLLLPGLIATLALVAGSSSAFVSERVVYREDFVGETAYETTPEIDEIAGVGLVGLDTGGPGDGPVLTGSAARATIAAAGPTVQWVFLPFTSFGAGPARLRTTASSWSTASEGAGLVGLEVELEAASGSARVSALVEIENDPGGTTVGFGGFVLGQNPAAGPGSSLSLTLTPAELAVIEAGGAFEIELTVDRDAATATATIEVSGQPPQSLGPISIDATTAGLEIESAAMVLAQLFGVDPFQVDFDAFEISRVYTTSFTVDTLADEVDAAIGDSACATSTGFCSLRAAIQESNAIAGPGEVIVPAGEYVTTIAGTGDDAAATGDLDITDALTLRGAGRDVTTIDGGGLDRVLHVLFAFDLVHAQVMDLAVRNGAAVLADNAVGGGIENSGRLDLLRCEVSANRANLGGGILNRERLFMDDCIVRENAAENLGFTNAFAGGIASASSSAGGGDFVSAFIRNSAIVDNEAFVTGGLEFGNASFANVSNTTISGNTSPQVTVRSTDVTLRHVTIADGFGVGLQASSFDPTKELEIVNSAISDFTACNLSTTAPMTILLAGHNASSDTSCGFVGAGDVEGVPLELEPLADVGGTLAHVPMPSSPLIDSGDDAECAFADQRGELRPQDGDASGTAECDIGAIEVPEPGLGALTASGLIALWALRARRVRRRDRGGLGRHSA